MINKNRNQNECERSLFFKDVYDTSLLNLSLRQEKIQKLNM